MVKSWLLSILAAVLMIAAASMGASLISATISVTPAPYHLRHAPAVFSSATGTWCLNFPSGSPVADPRTLAVYKNGVRVDFANNDYTVVWSPTFNRIVIVAAWPADAFVLIEWIE